MRKLDIIKKDERLPPPKLEIPYEIVNEGVRCPQLVWTSTIFDYGGYALMSRNYIRGLTNRGYRVGVEAIRGTTEISQEEKEYFNSKRKLVKDNKGIEKGIPYLNPNQINVVAHLPLWNVPKFKQNIIYSMMESKDTNRPFIERCNHYYDRCWTPTEYNKNDFKKNGMTIPITVMPIGVDDIYFNKNYIIKNMAFNFKVYSNKMVPDQPSGFKFLSVFRWSFRKGFDVLLKSFLSEFTDSDDVSLVIFSRHAAMSHDIRFSQAIENDILKIIKEHSNKNHAPIYWCSDCIEQELMPSVYDLGDAFISTSRGEGLCTVPNAKIKTPDGIKEIKDIKEGDLVFSHTGIARKVLNIFKKTFSGKILKISCYGRNNQYLYLTPNHNIFSLKCNGINPHDIGKFLNGSYFDSDKLIFKNCNKVNFEWIECSKLKKGDLLFYPKLNYNEKIDFINLEDIEIFKSRFNFTENSIFSKVVNQTGEIKEQGRSQLPIKKIKITENFMKLCGYYVSEGNASSGNLNFSFSNTEYEFHNDLKNLMKLEFGIDNYKDYTYSHKNSLNIVYCNVIVKILFSYLFGGKAREKRLPKWFFSLEKKYIYSFLKTLFRGDGCLPKKDNIFFEKTSYSTCSLELANNVFDLLQRLGISASIKSRVHKNKKFYGYGNTSYCILITNVDDSFSFLENIDEPYGLIENITKKRKSHRVFKTNEDFQILKVKNIEEISYNGDVHNLHVDGENTYICENIAVHNCIPTLEASQMGLPVIAPYHTGFTDYITNDNSYKIDVDEWVVCNDVPEWSGWITRDFYGQKFPRFGQKTIEQTRYCMRGVKENYTEALKKNKKMKQLIGNKYTWKKCLDCAEKEIVELLLSTTTTLKG